MKKKIEDSFTYTIVEIDGSKRAKINAPDYYQHYLKIHTQVGDQGTMYMVNKKPTRSEQQLRYFMVIATLIGNHTGYTKDETYEALVRLMWGEREIKLGKDTVKVRRSISDAAKLKKDEMAELISFSLEKAFELEVKIPTLEELGMISNYKPYQ